MFVGPWVDYLFIGAGITFPIFAVTLLVPALRPLNDRVPYSYFIAINAAHFAASTVRFYQKADTRAKHPFLSGGAPLVCLAVVALALLVPRVGGHLRNLYLTWSPYHYAAQTYGLAVMYAARSGARLSPSDKQQMWWVCMLPCAYALVTAPYGGLGWFVPAVIEANALFQGIRQALAWLLLGAVLLVPFSLFWQLRRRAGPRVPPISLLLQVTNGLWWIGSDYLNAWFWTSVCHSIQYLVIAIVRHVDEQVPEWRAGGREVAVALHGAAFYAASLVAGAVLFLATPWLFAMAGFRALEAHAMVTIVINLHHFVVDGYIWRSPVRRLTARAVPG